MNEAERVLREARRDVLALTYAMMFIAFLVGVGGLGLTLAWGALNLHVEVLTARVDALETCPVTEEGAP